MAEDRTTWTRARGLRRGGRRVVLTIFVLFGVLLLPAAPVSAQNTLTLEPAAAGPVPVGEGFTLTSVWQTDEPGVHFADWVSISVPAGVRYDSMSDLPYGDCPGPTTGPGRVVCNIPPIGPGTPLQLHFTGVSPVDDARVVVNLSSSIDNVTASATVDVVDASVGVDLYPDLQAPGVVGAGQEVAISGSVASGGSEPADDVVLAVDVAVGLEVTAASWGEGTACDVAGSVVTCALGTVAAHARVPVRISTAAGAAGSGTTTVTVTSATPDDDRDPHANEQLLPVEIAEVIDTSVELIYPSLRMGEPFWVRGWVHNHGPFAAPVSLRFDIPDNFRITGIEESWGTGFVSCSWDEQVATCEGDPLTPMPVDGQYLVEVDLEPVSAVDVEPVVLTTWAEGYAEPVPDPNPSTRTAALRFPPSYVGGSVTSETPPDGTTVFAVRPTDAWPSFSATVVADGATSGSYEFANAFDPGAYQFVVVPLTTSGLPARWVGGGADRSTAATYHVIGDGNSIDLPAVELVPVGVIAGTVTDGSAGIPDVEVRAFGLGERWVPRAVARTDADGTYRLPAMPDGTYEIAFVPAAGTSAAQQWYDGAATRSAAEPVVIAGNQSVVSVDAVLDASGSATGTVTGPDGGPVAGVRVVAFADTDTWVGTAESLTAADGTYELVAPAGSYRLRFVPPAASGFASTWLTGQSRWTSPPVAIRADEPAIGVDQELGRT